MEKKDNTFSYLNSKMIEIIFTTLLKSQNYYELIILNVVIFDFAPLNAKCNNLFQRRMILPSIVRLCLFFQAKSVDQSQFLD